jgi:hypothetical protein
MKKALRSLTAAAAVTLALASPASAEIFFQDTYLSLRTLFGDKQPGFNGEVPATEFNVQYVNAWTYGSNFVSIDFEQFGAGDRASNSQVTSGVKGARKTSNSAELYSVWRTTVSGNAVTGSKAFSFGPISDVGWTFGLDWATQNDQFAVYKRWVVTGPSFSVAVPKGFWTIGTFVAKEMTTNGFTKNNTATFDPTFFLSNAFLFPFSIGSVDAKVTGFINVIGPKGKGNSQDNGHSTEVLAHPKLMFDVGKIVGLKPGQFDAGVGYEYWFNKFGNTPKHTFGNGTEQHAVFIEGGYHF